MPILNHELTTHYNHHHQHHLLLLLQEEEEEEVPKKKRCDYLILTLFLEEESCVAEVLINFSWSWRNFDLQGGRARTKLQRSGGGGRS
jgi:hypothetical protein